MRYDCDEPAFEGDFVEFSDSFSRAQQRAIWAAGGEDEELFLSLLRAKIVSLHLSCLDAPPILKADDLVPDRVEAMDVRLYTWFSYAWVAHLRGLSDLGNAIGRRLFSTSATIATMEADPVSLNHS
jgi:hypothetical protein